MRNMNMGRGEEKRTHPLPDASYFRGEANGICERALYDAKLGLHPLLQALEIHRLDQRSEFVQGFKLALERRIAQRLVVWHPSVQAVFKFEVTRVVEGVPWDGMIHLLIKVPRLSDRIRMFARKLDVHLLDRLKQLGWPRFGERVNVLEVQQVTVTELRHGISYGAMFHAFHNVPLRVWPQKKQL